MVRRFLLQLLLTVVLSLNVLNYSFPTFLTANDVSISSLGRALLMEYDAVGGPVLMFVYMDACRVFVVEENRVSKGVVADLIISQIEKEFLISDSLTEELGIAILSLERFVKVCRRA